MAIEQTTTNNQHKQRHIVMRLKIVLKQQIFIWSKFYRPKKNDDEITNNDGSVVETLDTDLHNEPGYISDHSLAGSNRADYYEKRSQGKSDVEEEREYRSNHPVQ